MADRPLGGIRRSDWASKCHNEAKSPLLRATRRSHLRKISTDCRGPTGGGFENFQEALTAGYDFLNSYHCFSVDVLLKEEGVISVCGQVHHETVQIYPNHAIDVDTRCRIGERPSAIELPFMGVWSVSEDGVE